MQYFIDLVIIGLSIGMIYALVAIGISLIFSGLDIVHFAHGEIYMFGAFIGLMLFKHLGIGYVPTLLAIVLTGLFGAFLERVFLPAPDALGRRLHGRRHGHDHRRLRHVDRAPERRLPRPGGRSPCPSPVPFGMPMEFGDLVLPQSYVWIVGTALSLMVTLHLFLKKTRWGLAIRAVAHNKDIAYLMGINVPLMISAIFGIGCALGAAAGVLVGPVNPVSVQMGIGVLMKAFAAAVVGGFGSLPGAVLGGILVGVAGDLGAGFISGNYKDVYAFLLLITVLMIKPSGILGVDTKVRRSA